MRGLVVLIAFAFALAGCGAAPSPEEAVLDAGDNTSDAKTARIEVAFDAAPVTRGAFDLTEGTGTFEGDGESARMIYAKNAVYELVSSQLTIAVPGQKRWLKSPRSEYVPLLLDPFADTPADLLAFLDVAGEAQPVGTGEERGEQVKRYSAILDLNAFLASLPAQEQAEMREYFDEYWLEWDTSGVPLLLALDSEGRFRRADLVLADGEELTIEFFDYGVEVDASAPPENEVLSWAEYEKLLRKECEELKKKGLEKTKPHCFSCGAGEGEA
jgi:hypothetical protein